MSLYDNIVCCTQMYTHKSLPCCLTMNSLCLHLFIIQYTIGDEDRKTWEGVDYTSLVDGIWRTISIHAHHQQRCENFVQMSALIARTMVGEARRTWRAIAISATIRRFNIWAIEIMRARPDHAKKRSSMKRVEGRWRIQLFSEYIDDLLEMIRLAREDIDETTYRDLMNSIRDKTNKASKEEDDKLVEGIKSAVEKPLKEYAAEKPKEYTLTVRMDGKVLLSSLTKSSGKEEHVNAEFMARNILEMKEFIEEYGELDESSLKDVPFLDRKKFIKTHEVLIEVQRNTLASFDDVWKETNAITPQSDMVRAMLERNSEEEEATTTEPNMGL